MNLFFSITFECRGSFWMQGPQPVSTIPELVGGIFEKNPDIQQISVSTDKKGVIYTRIHDLNSIC